MSLHIPQFLPDRFVYSVSGVTDLAGLSAELYRHVWRFDFDQPGVAVIQLRAGWSSIALRRLMATLKEELSREAVSQNQSPFACHSVFRYDQPISTRFHLDGGPESSLLILGYEPSEVVSRLWIADHTRAAKDLGITPDEMITRHNPLRPEGDELLSRYAVEVPPATRGGSRIVLINNSLRPFAESRKNPLGVMHKATIVSPAPETSRVINSMILGPGKENTVEDCILDEFLNGDPISGSKPGDIR